MSRIYGSETCVLDAKGRINVPARMRRNLAPEANDQFVMVRSFDPCVNLYPADEFPHFEAKLKELRSGDPDAREFVRAIYASLHESTLDGQGRVHVHDRLIKGAKLPKEVMLIGLGDHIEIWDPKLYEQRAAGISQEQMSRLAEKLL
jgi:MraZ protein